MAHDTAHHPPLATHPTLLDTLPPSSLPRPNGGPDSPRLIIIGDVHGQLAALDALLSKAGYSATRGDQVVFTGDMINKGPDSAGVVDRAIAMGARGVRGNHEDRILRVWWAMTAHKRKPSKSRVKAKSDPNNLVVEEEEEKKEDFEEESGEYSEKSREEKEKEENREDEEPEANQANHLTKTQKSDLATANSLTAAQLSWLAHLPVILRVGPLGPSYGDLVVVHAGLVPGVPLERQDPWAAMNMRTLLSPPHSHPHPRSAASDAVTSNLYSHSHPHPKFLPSEGREGRPWAEVWDELQRMQVHEAETGARQQTQIQDQFQGQETIEAKRSKAQQATTVVYGHDAKTGLSVRRYAFGLDSSCVKGGDLTALVFEPTTPSPSTSGEAANKHGITHRIISVSCEAAL